MTKQEALNHHNLMWEWIFAKTLTRKRCVDKIEFIAWLNFGGCEDEIENDCYCCEYAKQFGDGCCNCPVVWGTEGNGQARCFCEREGSPYQEWRMNFKSGDYELAAELALQIANLPERMDTK